MQFIKMESSFKRCQDKPKNKSRVFIEDNRMIASDNKIS